jgi:energy-coupling factor transporter ATP-binding protein EcfA2
VGQICAIAALVGGSVLNNRQHKTLSLTDFRAFPGPAPAVFDLDGQNLLVYGENGSGKSSLFYALQGFFSPSNPADLLKSRNTFSDAGIGCVKVEVGFDDLSVVAWHIVNGSLSNPRNMLLQGPTAATLHPGHGARPNVNVTEAAKFSAVLDYRSLLNTNYKHGDAPINLFNLAVNGFLASYIDLASNKTIGQLWTDVLGSKPIRNTTKTLASCVSACNSFNNAIRKALALLLVEAQSILQTLSPHGLVLVGLPFTDVTYNFAKKWADKGFNHQSIGLEIEFKNQIIDRPQLFLNEARQSAIGLALYLGARLACAPQTTPHLKLLVLDDVLVGLDHSNRLPVLNVLVSQFADWQIILLTHDKGWFDLARQRLPSNAWACCEIYEGDPAANAPMPIVRKTVNRPAPALLQKARDLLMQGYTEAAANYVRQAFETGIRAACELKNIKIPYKQDISSHQAQDLLTGLKSWQGTLTVPKLDWDASLNQLQLMKDVVMNPYSHPSAPNIPRQEVANAADAVDAFLALARKK